MQDSGMNPFAAASNLGRKRGADESGMDLGMPMSMSDAAPPASHGVMPLPKRRIVRVFHPLKAVSRRYRRTDYIHSTRPTSMCPLWLR